MIQLSFWQDVLAEKWKSRKEFSLTLRLRKSLADSGEIDGNAILLFGFVWIVLLGGCSISTIVNYNHVLFGLIALGLSLLLMVLALRLLLENVTA